MNCPEYTLASTRTLNRVFCLLSLLLIIYAGIFSWQSWREEKANRIFNLQNIMALGSRAIDAYFMHLEACMLALNEEIIETDETIDIDTAFHQIKHFKGYHPELMNICFNRIDGEIMFTAETPPGNSQPPVTQDPSFQQYSSELQQGNPLRIGRPIALSDSHGWRIPLRYVINDKEGKPAYIISAHLPIEILQNYWKDAPFTQRGALGLIRDDGYLVSRYPIPAQIEMEKIYGIPRKGTLITYLRQHQFPIDGSVVGPSGLDGPDYLHTFHRLEHFPITLFIVTPMSDFRSAWWDNVQTPYFLSAFLLIGGYIVYRFGNAANERMGNPDSAS